MINKIWSCSRFCPWSWFWSWRLLVLQSLTIGTWPNWMDLYPENGYFWDCIPWEQPLFMSQGHFSSSCIEERPHIPLSHNPQTWALYWPHLSLIALTPLTNLPLLSSWISSAPPFVHYPVCIDKRAQGSEDHWGCELSFELELQTLAFATFWYFQRLHLLCAFSSLLPSLLHLIGSSLTEDGPRRNLWNLRQYSTQFLFAFGLVMDALPTFCLVGTNRALLLPWGCLSCCHMPWRISHS